MPEMTYVLIYFLLFLMGFSTNLLSIGFLQSLEISQSRPTLIAAILPVCAQTLMRVQDTLKRIEHSLTVKYIIFSIPFLLFQV